MRKAVLRPVLNSFQYSKIQKKLFLIKIKNLPEADRLVKSDKLNTETSSAFTLFCVNLF